MNFLVCLEIGLREIAAHKFRSFLSMLGIVLGVSSLIAMMAIVSGIEIGTRAFMQQIGGLELVNVVNKEISNDMFEFWNLSPGRTLMDAYAIRESVPMVGYVSPEMSQAALISSGPVSDRMSVLGVWPDHYVVARHELAEGRFLTDLDLERSSRSVVIGDEIARRFWPNLTSEQIIGRRLTINQSPFVVVGVLIRYEREQDKRLREIMKSRQKTAMAGARGARPHEQPMGPVSPQERIRAHPADDPVLRIQIRAVSRGFHGIRPAGESLAAGLQPRLFPRDPGSGPQGPRRYPSRGGGLRVWKRARNGSTAWRTVSRPRA